MIIAILICNPANIAISVGRINTRRKIADITNNATLRDLLLSPGTNNVIGVN